MGWCCGPVGSCNHTRLERAEFCANVLKSVLFPFGGEREPLDFASVGDAVSICHHREPTLTPDCARLFYFFSEYIEIRHTTGNILTAANHHGLKFVKALACEPLFHRQWLTDFNSCYCINILLG